MQFFLPVHHDQCSGLQRLGKKYNTGYSGCTHPPFWTLQPLVVQTHCLSLRSRSTSSWLTALLHPFTQKRVNCSCAAVVQKTVAKSLNLSVYLANLTLMWATFQSLIVGKAGRILLSTFRVRAKICCFHFSSQVVIPNIIPIFINVITAIIKIITYNRLSPKPQVFFPLSWRFPLQPSLYLLSCWVSFFISTLCIWLARMCGYLECFGC